MDTDKVWYCRNCCHITKPVGDPAICMHCKSLNIGFQPRLLIPRRAMGIITEPADREPTKHQRLKDGFALLRGDSIL